MALSIASTTKRFHVAVVGVGLVGGELIKQLLAFPQPSPFRLVALASSKTTLYHPDGLTLAPDAWKTMLASSGLKPDLPFLVRELAGLVRPGQEAVFVDNTSSDAVAALYPDLLKLGVHVVTPNKKAFSAELGLYERILAASLESGARCLNEATVGAGLPVVSTLKDLVATGDKVVKIQGVFSGTMSYIFNEFSTGNAEGPSFSSVVSVAREKGYTEPHPADDLNGADVARKLTILSRVIPVLRTALPEGYKSVQTKSLVPVGLEDAATGDDFIARLPQFDAQFDAMRAEAAKAGQVLRYAGVIDVQSGVIKAGLERYPATHPFATALGGSDNVIVFHTERYGARPLVVQGAGAGAAVTAMGVMSDLLKLI
ncbi:aspartate kinase homoserine dehydrogenase [Epithele typhae]|uniref:aspartate kinase homoserine dehydrogenase n=1 Tax=Epithele typhae TaxID=378194 RepID=UPI0020079424|nr:aspartate kinase homoserine dehydrogenase [Epithele typhae]KAH9941859.1 aspartate kinase homoserine dehydrogenase [Epithele typhae]